MGNRRVGRDKGLEEAGEGRGEKERERGAWLGGRNAGGEKY